MKKVLYAILYVLLFAACSGPKVDHCPDLSQAVDTEVSAIADSVSLIPINTDRIIGAITTIKYSQGRYFLLDETCQEIIACDSVGNVISVLSKHGKGPGEYLDIGTFAVDDQVLTVYSRHKKELLSYDVNDMSFLGNRSIEYYINSCEFIAPRKLVAIKEYGDKKPALIVIDLDSDSTATMPIPVSYVASELSTDAVFSRSSARVTYCNPGEVNTVYDVNGGDPKAISTIGFSRYSIDKRYWEFEEGSNPDLGELLIDETFAMLPCYYSEDDDRASFFYLSAVSRTAVPNLQLYTYDKRSGLARTIGKLYLCDKNCTITPVGVTNGAYAAVIQSDQIVSNADFVKLLPPDAIGAGVDQTYLLLFSI